MKIKSPAGQVTRDFRLEIKADDVAENGTFKGYGSVFGVVDSYREIVDPGAFAESLAEIKAKGRQVPVLWQHQSTQPIGGYTSLYEDATGLYVEGELDIEDDPVAKTAWTKLKKGRVTGLSIGFYVREDSYDRVERVTHLKKLDLLEVSLVTFPACDPARVESVKAGQIVRQAFSEGRLPSMQDLEAYLREAGASKSVAAGITGRGLRAMLRGEPEGDSVNHPPAELKSLTEALAGFKLPSF
jgi:uncharacterized protein